MKEECTTEISKHSNAAKCFNRLENTELDCKCKQWRIHSGVVGVARPLGNHGNNLEAPICDLLELGSSGSDSHANCSTKILNQDSAGRGRRSSARMESNESYILQNNAENPAPTQLPLRFYKQKGVPRFIDKFKLSIQLQSSSFGDLPQSWTAPSTRG
ncbi:hypothetical protein ACFX2I_006523 [Malus domestica]